jgi:hypothetical protein
VKVAPFHFDGMFAFASKNSPFFQLLSVAKNERTIVSIDRRAELIKRGKK